MRLTARPRFNLGELRRPRPSLFLKHGGVHQAKLRMFFDYGGVRAVPK